MQNRLLPALLMPALLGAPTLAGADSPKPAAANTTEPAPMQPASTTPGVAQPQKPGDAPPATRTDDVVDRLYGTAVPDPYRWLEDAGAPEVREWMATQDGYARSHLAALPGHDRLAERLRQLYYLDSMGAPTHRGSRYFYRRTHADKEKAIVYWREGEHGKERVLLDPNTMSADGSVSLGVCVPSWDGRLVAYTLKANNSDEATLYVLDVASGQVREGDTIEGAKYAYPSWTPDSRGFYYTFLPSTDEHGAKLPVDERPGWAEVRYHAVGAAPQSDALVREKTGDPTSFIDAQVSRDGHWLFLNIQHGWTSNDVWFRDLRAHKGKSEKGKKETAAWQPLAVGQPSLYSVEAYRDRFYVRTNDGAPRYRVLAVDPAHPERSAWKELVAEAPGPSQWDGAVLDDARILGGKLALTWMDHAHSRVTLRDLDGKNEREVALPGAGHDLGTIDGLSGRDDEDTVYFGYTSFLTPQRIYRLSVKSGATKEWSHVEVPVDTSPYVVEQVFYPSKDGTKISMFLVHRKDLPRDGSTPFLLYGYGGFDVSLQPGFAGSIIPWLEAGGGYAMPNLRGGGEYGEAWHKAGMREHKQNVFDDFIGAAEFLIKEGYTKPERLVIRGGSNGGLLVGAATTQRPDLYRAVICQVPLLDMVRYHQFGSGRTWIEEYGSSETEAGFRTLFAYSPYHHVKIGEHYPALLMMSADHDDRVDPMHARKMAAALQAAQAKSGSPRPTWLRIEKHSGHGGADLVKATVEQTADWLAFAMWQVGMQPTEVAPTKTTEKTMTGNPLFSESKLPFQAPPFDQIQDTDYQPALEEGMKQQLAEVQAIADNPAPPTFANTLVAMEKSGQLLTRASNVFFAVAQANSNPTLQKTETEEAPRLAAHSDAIYLNPKLFARVKAIYDQREKLKLKAEDRALVERYYRDFVRAGALLPEADQAKLRQLNQEESSLSTEFKKKLLAATKAGAVTVEDKALLAGLSDGDLAAAAEAATARGEKGKWTIALQNTTQQPAQATLKDRAARERLFEASVHRADRGDADDTRAVVTRLAQLRAEKAKLLGFPNWAAYRLDTQMAKTPKAAEDLLTGIVPAATAKARSEAAAMQALIDKQEGKDKRFPLAAWDWQYYAEQVRKAEYDLDESAVRPYFELNNVLENGVFYAAHQLYGITFHERHDIPVYHPDVRVFEVRDADGKPLALFYGDYYKRDEKGGGAWMSDFVLQSGLLKQKPVVFNVCNFTKPAPGQPALLTSDDVITMFHEFGHALHGMFSDVKYPTLAGTNVPRDFVEFPSQFNEHWAMEPKVFANYAKHYQTGATMPQDLVAKLRRAKTFNQGFATTEYLEAALIDLAWHTLTPEKEASDPVKDVAAFEQAALKNFHVDLPEVPPRYHTTYFAHIFEGGYSAGYYAYLWTAVLRDDAYQWFEEHGGLTRKNGDRFRKMILSRGHTGDLAAMYRAFRGRDPRVDALLEDRGLKAERQ